MTGETDVSTVAAFCTNGHKKRPPEYPGRACCKCEFQDSSALVKCKNRDSLPAPGRRPPSLTSSIVGSKPPLFTHGASTRMCMATSLWRRR